MLGDRTGGKERRRPSAPTLDRSVRERAGSTAPAVEPSRECESSVENCGDFDIPTAVSYRSVAMSVHVLPSASPSAPDPHVDATGGLHAFALFYLGYAYIHFYLPMAGGT